MLEESCLAKLQKEAHAYRGNFEELPRRPGSQGVVARWAEGCRGIKLKRFTYDLGIKLKPFRDSLGVNGAGAKRGISAETFSDTARNFR